MKIDYARIGSSTLRDILLSAEKAADRLAERGELRDAEVVRRLIRSRLGAHTENVQANKKLRAALAERKSS